MTEKNRLILISAIIGTVNNLAITYKWRKKHPKITIPKIDENILIFNVEVGEYDGKEGEENNLIWRNLNQVVNEKWEGYLLTPRIKFIKNNLYEISFINPKGNEND